MPPRSRSTFAVRTATDDADQLERGSNVFPSPSPANENTPLLDIPPSGRSNAEQHVAARGSGAGFFTKWFSRPQPLSGKHSNHDDPPPASPGNVVFADISMPNIMQEERKRPSTAIHKPRPGAFPRPVGGTSKLGTFAGVFVPTTLNVLSILMFLRFGFILGQAGVLGMMGKPAVNHQHRFFLSSG